MPTLLHAEFMADICQHPADDTPRLIYADWLKEHDAWTWDTVLVHVLHHPRADGPRLLAALWLDEHGDPDRAEFIRTQCELARIDEAWRDAGESQTPDGFVKVGRLRRRERELLDEHGDCWRLETTGRTGCPFMAPHGFRRGFVEEVTLTTEDFLRHARALFRAAPLVRVTPSDREPQDYHNNPERDDYEGRLFGWRRGLDDQNAQPYHLPGELWDLLVHHPECDRHGYWADFADRDTALSALHAAALLWGRRQAWPCPQCEGRGGCPGGRAEVWYKCPACSGIGHTVEEG